MSDIEAYLQWLTSAKGQRPRTVQARARQLRRFDRWLVHRDKTVRTATYKDILGWLPDDVGPDARRTYTAALSGFYAARWEDLEWDRQPVILIGREGAKGGNERRVVVPDALAVVLKARRLKHGWMARGPLGQGYNPESMSQWLANVLRNELGVDASGHQLRHWYATTLLRQGANVRVVQDALGHASLATTGLYLKVTISDQAVHAASLRP